MTRTTIRRWTTLLVAALATLLASCSTNDALTSVEAADGAIAHVLTIDIEADAQREALALAYDAQVLSFQPEAGFAILGLRAGADRMFPQAESNADAVTLAEANGISAWAGGISAWAGGISAWAGGISAWAGGVDSANPFPANVPVWLDAGLDHAHAVSAPRGAGTLVAVIDTGIDLGHPALTGKLAPWWLHWDYVDDDGRPAEVSGPYYGHGTATAGLVLQTAPGTTILPLRVLGPDGHGDLADVVEAIDDAVAYGADVINLSLGSSEDYAALRRIIGYARDAGVPVVASVGNHAGSVLYPAAYAATMDNVVAVGSLDADGVRSSFSARGPEVTVMASGEALTSLFPGGVASVTGTSFAAPFASGAAALLVAELEAHEVGWYDAWLLARDFRDMLESSADGGIYDLNDPADDDALGEGRIDAGAFVDELYEVLGAWGYR